MKDAQTFNMKWCEYRVKRCSYGCFKQKFEHVDPVTGHKSFAYLIYVINQTSSGDGCCRVLTTLPHWDKNTWIVVLNVGRPVKA